MPPIFIGTGPAMQSRPINGYLEPARVSISLEDSWLLLILVLVEELGWGQPPNGRGIPGLLLICPKRKPLRGSHDPHRRGWSKPNLVSARELQDVVEFLLDGPRHVTSPAVGVRQEVRHDAGA